MEVGTEKSSNPPGKGSGQQSLQHSSCESEMQRILLLKANEGNFQEMLHLLNEGVDINSTDENGCTVLHYAVQSDKLEIVQKLLEEEDIDISLENHENNIPLDMARTSGNQDIINVLVEKIIDSSLKVLDGVLPLDNPDGSLTDTEETVEEKKHLKATENKIESCLELLKEINKGAVSNSDLSYREALILIYFIETFALQISANETEKQELVNHFSQFYAEADIKLFSGARAKLLKSALDKRLTLSDIRKLINGSKVNFFKKLEEHVQYVSDGQELKISLEKLKNSYAETDPLTFGNLVRTEFEKFEEQSGKQRKIRRPEICEYVVKYYHNSLTTEGGNLQMSQNEDLVVHTKVKKKKEKKKKDKEPENFFIKLQKFVYYLEHSNSDAEPQSSNSRFDECIKSFEKSTPKNKLILIVEQEKNDVEPPLDDIDIVKDELKKLMLTIHNKNLTEEVLFNFIVNLYPALEKETKADLRNELGRLRNDLVHRFYECGREEFEKVIYPLKHLILQYYCAREVKKDLDSVEPDSIPNRIKKSFNNKFELFKEEFETGIKTSNQKPLLVSKDEAVGFSGYKLLRLSILEKCDEVETLVDEYLDFMSNIGCAKSQKDNSTVFNQSQDPSDTLGRRQMIEKFVELRWIYGKDNYDDKKKEFETALSEKYGVHTVTFGSHLEEICRPSKENDRNSIVDQTDRIQISNIIKFLKKIRDDYKLANKDIIFLYDRFLKKRTSFTLDENKDLLGNKSVRRASINGRINLLPLDKIVHISIGTEKLSVSLGKLISNMFSTFYNSYYECKMELSLEKIFTEEIFLDYLVEGETEDCLEELVDPYLKLTLMIDSEKAKDPDRKKCKKLHGADRRKIHEGFDRLKRLSEEDFQGNIDRDYYEKEKGEFKDLVLSYEVSEIFFKEFYEFCIPENSTDDNGSTKIMIETTGRNVVKKMIKDLKQNFKSDNARKNKTNLPNKAIISLYQKVPVELVHVQDLLEYKSVEACEKIKQLINSLDKIGQKKVRVQFGDEKLSLTVRKVVCDMLETFEGKLKLKSHNYMIIKKLVKIDFTAPYVVRLITKVESDEIIERKDLARLVQILVTKEDGVYIKHLNELLKIKSRKLNLYGEVCSVLLQPTFDVPRMCLIFQESQHVKGILTALKHRIRELKGATYNRNILEILYVVLTSINSSEYKTALEIMNDVLDVMRVIPKSEELGRETWCEIKLKVAKIKNSRLRDLAAAAKTAAAKATATKTAAVAKAKAAAPKAAAAKVAAAKAAAAEAAAAKATAAKAEAAVAQAAAEVLSILEKIPENVHPQFLLALSRKAYTQSLKKDYPNAKETCTLLYRKILHRVPGSGTNDASYTAEIYTKIRKSREYQDLLKTARRYEKYLDILKIREDIAFYSEKSGGVKNLEKALEIYKEVYSHKKINFGPEHPSTLKVMRSIAYVYRSLGYKMSNSEKYEDALKYHINSLVQNVRVLEIQIKSLTTLHSAVAKNISFVIENLGAVAKTYGKLFNFEAKDKIDKYLSSDVIKKLHDRIESILESKPQK